MQLLIASPLGPPAARRPFAYNSKRAAKVSGLQVSPQFSSIAAVSAPQLIQQWQVRITDATSIAIEIVRRLADQIGFQVLPRPLGG